MDKQGELIPSHGDVLAVVIALCFPFIFGFVSVVFFISSFVVAVLMYESIFSFDGIFILCVLLFFGFLCLFFSLKMFHDIHFSSMEDK